MYCARSSEVASSGTRINEGAAFSSVTRSTHTAINGSDKIAGTIHPVSQSYRDVTRGSPFAFIVIDMLWMPKSPCSRTKRYKEVWWLYTGMIWGMRRKIDCLAATAMGPTVLLSSSHPIMSPMSPIVALILDVKRSMQNSRVGEGTGSDLGFCSKRRSRSQAAAKSSGRLKLNNDARIQAVWVRRQA